MSAVVSTNAQNVVQESVTNDSIFGPIGGLDRRLSESDLGGFNISGDNFYLITGALCDIIAPGWFYNPEAAASGTIEGGYDTAQVGPPWDNRRSFVLVLLQQRFQRQLEAAHRSTDYTDARTETASIFENEYRNRNTVFPLNSNDHVARITPGYDLMTPQQQMTARESWFGDFRSQYNTFHNCMLWFDARYAQIQAQINRWHTDRDIRLFTDTAGTFFEFGQIPEGISGTPLGEQPFRRPLLPDIPLSATAPTS